jgi:SAM-dependent methyltransferase
VTFKLPRFPSSAKNRRLEQLAQQLRETEAAFSRLQDEHAAVQQRLKKVLAGVADSRDEIALILAELQGPQEGLPPPHLQVRQVGGVWGKNFHIAGRVMFDQLADAFRAAGQPLETAARILDFGCGAGRVLWSFKDFPHVGEVWGCDIDAESIAWDTAHLGHLGQFYCNPHLPPTQFPDDHFDAIYSVSVFTHLPEDMQFAWLGELRRILKPGGVLCASFHGEHYWADVHSGVKSEVESRGFAYRTGDQTDGLPEFYMVAYHAEGYIRTQWARYFEIVGLHPKYLHDSHDLAVLRKK